MERNQVLVNFVSSEDLSGKEYYAIGPNYGLCGADGESCFGIIKDGGQASGDTCVAVVGGETYAYVAAFAGDDVEVGDPLICSAPVSIGGDSVKGLLRKMEGYFNGKISVSYPIDANSVDSFIFIAPFPCKVTGISEIHAVAGSDSGDVTLTVRRCQGTEGPTAGDDLLGAAKIDLKGTANTVQSPDLTETSENLILAAGDRLSVDFTGTLTSLAGGVVTVEIESITRAYPFAEALEPITADGSANIKKLIRIRIV